MKFNKITLGIITCTLGTFIYSYHLYASNNLQPATDTVFQQKIAPSETKDSRVLIKNLSNAQELFNTLSRYPNCTYTLEPFFKISKTIKFQEIADHMEIFICLLGIRLLVTKWHLERWKIDNVIHDYIEISELNNKLPTS